MAAIGAGLSVAAGTVATSLALADACPAITWRTLADRIPIAGFGVLLPLLAFSVDRAICPKLEDRGDDVLRVLMNHVFCGTAYLVLSLLFFPDPEAVLRGVRCEYLGTSFKELTAAPFVGASIATWCALVTGAALISSSRATADSGS